MREFDTMLRKNMNLPAKRRIRLVICAGLVALAFFEEIAQNANPAKPNAVVHCRLLTL
jgi:hypothetical protein